MKKRILGLDLGTNSIGWALVSPEEQKILGLNSRIIPMSQDILGDFEKGNSVSQTATRTGYRGTRRLRERHLLRRERLHRVLGILDFLPEHYSQSLDRYGNFGNEKEEKIAYFLNKENKHEFLFTNSYNEMLSDFRKNQPKLFYLKTNGTETKIPYDWTIYYLRKKALTQKIAKEELAWLLLNFNQKRGYYQLRGEDDDKNLNKLEEFYNLAVVEVQETGKGKKDGEIWYSVSLENGWVYRRSSKIPIFDWIGKNRDFIITTEIDDDGNVKKDKDGSEKRSFRSPKDDDWGLLKKKTENDILNADKTVGCFIYETLLQIPNQKIKGKLVRTIERNFYREELEKILACQLKFHPELQDKSLYQQAIESLYVSNEEYRDSIGNLDFRYLIVNDIIFYQRPLKSKKSEISDCTFEFRNYKDEEGKEITEPLKCISRSHPLFQEFRLWQWIQNVRIYQREKQIDGKLNIDAEVTNCFLKIEKDYVDLFDFLFERKDVDQKAFLKHFKLTPKTHRWNFIDDDKKIYPCNETHTQIVSRLAKVNKLPTDFLTKDIEVALWHILYSVRDKHEIKKALASFARRHNLDEESFVENFKKYPLIKSEYGSYSEKAIKKLLPLMRMGNHWKEQDIDHTTLERIAKIISGEYDEKIKNQVREKAVSLDSVNKFKALPLWLTSYIVYNRHSESGENNRWTTVTDIEKYLKEFKQHSLRNPIVEQVLIETLRVVRDIWKQYGNGNERLFDEIHVELGREMKNNAEDRKAITEINLKNENSNQRIRIMLAEFARPDYDIEGVRPYSIYQQDALKIFEDSVINSGIEIPEDIEKISKTAQPSENEVLKYRLWLEQKYRSPYTGEIIPLSKLFTPDYEIEHIIPQKVYFDDSFSNKVICESAVNKLKDAQLGFEFIKEHGSSIVAIGGGKSVQIFTIAQYEDFIKNNYTRNKGKAKKLLLDEIPDKMIERQLNDTRYISKIVKNLLSNLVRDVNNDDGVTSKNLISCNGAITSALKQDWGFNDIWNDLMLPRFERLNKLKGVEIFTVYNDKYQKLLPTVPIEFRKGFQFKRIDHRHHAMDALVIALTTRNHVNYLNNQTSLDKSNNKSKEDKLKDRQDLKHLLCFKTKLDENGNYKWALKKPWESITQDAKINLETAIVSFKQDLRVINKTVNYYQKYVDGKKQIVKQVTGDNWAIRKALHKETVYGEIILKRIKVPKDKILTATRKALDSTFDLSRIESITDTGIQKILKNFLQSKESNPELAFSPEGIGFMNQNIALFNDGVAHKPILKVRVFELGSKFSLGCTGNKKSKFVEAAKGTNLYFAIYIDENGKRNYETIPLNVVIERQKLGLSSCPERNDQNHILLFYLSPDDLVYLPSDEERISSTNMDFKELKKGQVDKIYKMVSSSGTQCFFIKAEVATCIVNKMEFSALNKMERSVDGDMIKEVCIKLKVDRLGNISI